MSNQYLHRVSGCRDCPYLIATTDRPSSRCGAPVGDPPDAALVNEAAAHGADPPAGCILRDLPLLVVGTFDGAGPS